MMCARLLRVLGAAAAAGALGAVFAAYLQPSFVLGLANRIVMCF